MGLTSDSHPITNVIYWKNPALSGWVLTGAIIFWAIVEGYECTVSALFLRCLQVGLLVSGAFSFWNARYHPQAPIEQDCTDYFEARTAALVPKLNVLVQEMKGMAQWRFPMETLGVLFGLQILFLVFGFFHAHTLFLTAVSILMSGPMGYLMNKKEADLALINYTARARAFCHRVKAKIPRPARQFLERLNTRESDLDAGRRI